MKAACNAGLVGVQRTVRRFVLLLVSAQFLSAAVWYKENLSFGLRDSILLFMAKAPSDPSTIYLGSLDGFVFATRNRGLAWNETRLIVQAYPFFGALRPQSSGSGVPLSASDALAGNVAAGTGSFALQDTFSLPYGATSEEFLDSVPYPTAYDPVQMPGLSVPGAFTIEDDAGGFSAGDDFARLGVGLKGSAPRLKAMLRTVMAPSVGMNLQQILVEMGIEPTVVNHIDVHPLRAEVALAATSMGLFKTEDGGIGWVPIFGGTSRNERDAQHVRFDPLDPSRIYLATMEGFFISDNAGERFYKVPGTLLEDIWVRWIEPAVTADGLVIIVAGTPWDGGWISEDRGNTWKQFFVETLPEANNVTSAAVDASDPDHVMLTTYDGMFQTKNRGRSWERAGGLLFTGTYLPRVVLDPARAGRSLACTERNVWESTDWGSTWRILYADDGDWYTRTLALDPKDPESVWVLTSAEVLRLSTAKPRGRSEREAVFREALSHEPSQSQVLAAAVGNLGVGPARRNELEWRANAANLLPRVNLVGGYLDAEWDAGLSIESWKQAYGVDRIYSRDGHISTPYAAVMLWWDLSDLLFERNMVSHGRVFDASLIGMTNVKYEIVRYCEERARLMRVLIVDPPADESARIDASLRFRELTEHLDVLTGGLFQDQVQEIYRGGIPWLDTLDI